MAREVSPIAFFGLMGAILGSFSNVPNGAVLGLVLGMIAGFLLSR
jgi:hypothetical protein